MWEGHCTTWEHFASACHEIVFIRIIRGVYIILMVRVGVSTKLKMKWKGDQDKICGTRVGFWGTRKFFLRYCFMEILEFQSVNDY